MKKATFKFVILFTFIFSIQNNLIAQDLTDREKADIQFQLNSFLSLADNEAVEVEYEPESDVVKSVEVKQSYKSKLQTLEGIASPTSNSYRVVDYIEFGNKKNNKVEIKLNFEGVDMMNTYSISSTYSFESKKFDNPEDIFAYMCLAKREGWTQNETIENQQSQNSSIDTAENQTTQINTTAENIDKQTQNTTNTTLKYILLSVLGICFICYIIALIRTRQEKMITIVNWYDFILLVLPFLLIIISLFIAKTHNAIFITLLVIACLSFLSSMAWSIFANKGSVFNMIVAVFAKLFVILIVWIAIAYIFRGKNQNNSNYENMKHDGKTFAAIGIAGFLIFSLIGNGDNHEVITKLQSKV